MDQDGTEAADLELLNLARVLWHGRLPIALVTVLCAAGAMAYAFITPKIFRSEALVQPQQESPGAQNLASVTAQFGGIADLAGLPLAGGNEKAVAVATLKSRTVIEAFIKDRNLLPILYESKWDADAKTWRTTDPEQVPTIWQAYNDFTKSILSISEDRKSGLVTVAIEWKDPSEAQQWVTELIARTNAYLKADAIRKGERNLAYLEEESQKIGQVELRQSLFGLVEAEMNKLMVAKGGEEFALRTIDAAVVPKRKVWPPRLMLTLAGIVGGLFLGAVLVLTREHLHKL